MADMDRFFLTEVNKRKEMVMDYLLQEKFINMYSPPILPPEISWCVIGEITDKENNIWHSYIRRGGKSLRPAILLFSCGLVGGNENISIPAAASIEVYHTFTLIHDDIIDRDSLRRKEKTVHEFLKEVYLKQGSPEEEAIHLGISVGIISGDLIQGWSNLILNDLYFENNVAPDIVLSLSRELNREVTIKLASGQTKDIQFEKLPISMITINDIIKMEEEKTGVLYEYAGRAGAMIGLNTSERDNEIVTIIASLSNKCGIAFQLQDDILGIVGDSKVLGKPIDSDIREGKRTTIVRYAWENGNIEQKKKIEDYLTLKNKISQDQIIDMKKLLIDLNGISKTKELAIKYLEMAKTDLNSIKARYSDLIKVEYANLIEQWIAFMINREY